MPQTTKDYYMFSTHYGELLRVDNIDAYLALQNDVSDIKHIYIVNYYWHLMRSLTDHIQMKYKNVNIIQSDTRYIDNPINDTLEKIINFMYTEYGVTESDKNKFDKEVYDLLKEGGVWDGIIEFGLV